MSPDRAPPSGVADGEVGLFFDGLGMALMSGHHIDFVALDLAFQHDRRATIDDPLAELADHRSGVVLVDVQLLGDLQPRQIQAHQVEAGDPGPQRLVVAGEDGISEVIEALTAALALVALAMGFGIIPAVLDDRVAGASGAGHPIGPSHLPDRLITLDVVEEILDVHDGSTPPGAGQRSRPSRDAPDGLGRL